MFANEDDGHVVKLSPKEPHICWSVLFATNRCLSRMGMLQTGFATFAADSILLRCLRLLRIISSTLYDFPVAKSSGLIPPKFAAITSPFMAGTEATILGLWPIVCSHLSLLFLIGA
jgi:hypothetical protein